MFIVDDELQKEAAPTQHNESSIDKKRKMWETVKFRISTGDNNM
jgi:hypothetical protein